MKVTKEAGPGFAALKATLNAGEHILVEPGAMIAQRNLRMVTGMPKGGIFSEMRRLLAAQSFSSMMTHSPRLRTLVRCRVR